MTSDRPMIECGPVRVTSELEISNSISCKQTHMHRPLERQWEPVQFWERNFGYTQRRAIAHWCCTDPFGVGFDGPKITRRLPPFLLAAPRRVKNGPAAAATFAPKR